MKEHPRKRRATSRILQVLRDQIWQFVAALITVVAIFSGYHISSLQQETKALQVVILASTSLVEVEQSVAERVEILYGDQSITDLSVFQVKVENSGNQPIREEDYARSIRFVFPPEAEIVEAKVSEASPDNIGVILQKEQNITAMSPVLLNEGDQVIVRFLVSNIPSNGEIRPFTVDARIAGVKEVKIVSAIEGRGDEKDVSITLAWVFGGAAGFGLGFITSGVLGFTAQRILLARDQLKAYRRPQKVSADTEETPLQVLRESIAAGFRCGCWALFLVVGVGGFVWVISLLLK